MKRNAFFFTLYLALVSCASNDGHLARELATSTEAIKAFGIVNSVDTVGQRVSITHGPIPQLNWAPMKMDFEISPELKMPAELVGRKIQFQMKVEQGSRYVLTAYQLQ